MKQSKQEPNRIPPSEASLLRLAAVKAKIGMSRSWIYERIKSGQFPAPKLLGKRAVGWIDKDVADWIESRTSCNEARETCPR